MAAFAGLIDGFRERSGEQSFLDRLDDLRGRLIASLVVVVATTLVGFYIAAWPLTLSVPRVRGTLGPLGAFDVGGWSVRLDILGFFVAPIEPFLDGSRLKYLSPTDPFFITLKLAFCIGLVLALPFLLRQAWGLLSPLMLEEEKRLVAPAVGAGAVLFLVGATFCYLFVVPLMLKFTMGFQMGSLEQSIVIGEYLKLILRMLIAFGLAFELPIVILLGTVLGIVTPEFLAAQRRMAIAIIVLASAFVTPPDVGSLTLLAVPVILLYEVSIILSRAVLARRARVAVAPEV